jgi:predicted PurR-regulated permease PerM
MSEYVLIFVAFLLTIALLSLIDFILRVLSLRNFYGATLNLLLFCILIMASFIIINWNTGVKLVLG